MAAAQSVPRDLETRISRLESIEEIKRLQVKYASLVDNREMDKILDLLSDDFTATYASITLNSKAALLKFLREEIDAKHSTMCHLMLNPDIEVDGKHATGRWYLLAHTTAVTPEGEIATRVIGKYENEYCRIDGEWKFSSLSFRYLSRKID